MVIIDCQITVFFLCIAMINCKQKCKNGFQSGVKMHINEMYLTASSFMLLSRNGITDSDMLLAMTDEEIIALKNKRFPGEIIDAVRLLREIGEERFFEEWVLKNNYLGVPGKGKLNKGANENHEN